MRAQLGFALIVVGFAASLLGVVTLAYGIATKRAAVLVLGRRYVVVLLAAAVGAFAIMESALLAHDYSIQYVAEQRRARHARALHVHRGVERARRLDPPVGARTHRLHRGDRVALPPACVRSAGRVGDARAVRGRGCSSSR